MLTEFHASSEAIIGQLPEKRLQSEIYENLKTIHTECGAWCVWRNATFFKKYFLECLQHQATERCKHICKFAYVMTKTTALRFAC